MDPPVGEQQSDHGRVISDAEESRLPESHPKGEEESTHHPGIDRDEPSGSLPRSKFKNDDTDSKKLDNNLSLDPRQEVHEESVHKTLLPNFYEGPPFPPPPHIPFPPVFEGMPCPPPSFPLAIPPPPIHFPPPPIHFPAPHNPHPEFALPPSGMPPQLSPPPPVTGDAAAALQYYESQMRDHAARYANAAAGAAWAAMQVANSDRPLFAAAGSFPPPAQQAAGDDAGGEPSESPALELPLEGKRSNSRRKRRQHPPREIVATTVPTRTGRRRVRSDNDSSSSGTPSRRWAKKTKKKNPDENLIGKMPVPALYEWCAKRRFHLVFEYTAQQPPYAQHTVKVFLEADPHNLLGSAEGAAVSTAKQLAARRALEKLIPGVVFCPLTSVLKSLPNEESTTPEDSLAQLTRQQLAIGQSPSDSKKRPSSSLPKYSGTSNTTSEEDDYYFSTGSFLCHELLNALVNDDDALPEKPQFTYSLLENPRHKIRRGAPRGTHQCTAHLKQFTPEGPKLLESMGIGSTKRQSRHGASAEMLLLLFPDCFDIKDAMQTAQMKLERVRGISSKGATARKFSKSPREVGSRPHKQHQRDSDDGASGTRDCTPSVVESSASPPFSDDACRKFCPSDAVRVRQSSRMLRLENLVDNALSELYEKHEALPEELTEDDVGRTVLRRASPEDLPCLRKLMETSPTVADGKITARWWSTASFVLVLCRALAGLEDPPLGCAVLTLGFDIDRGRLLRVSRIGNEPHLPQERLVECLETFALCMEATLIPLGRGNGEESLPLGHTRSPGTPYKPISVVESSRARTWPLQSVREEESESASSTERRPSKQQSTKPSKRTRRL